MDFDRVERAESTLDASFATSVRDEHVVEAKRRQVAGKNAAPIAGVGVRTKPLIVRIKITASTIPSVTQRGENDLVAVVAFGDQIATHFQFDNRVFGLDDRSGIDTEPTTWSSSQPLGGFVQHTTSR